MIFGDVTLMDELVEGMLPIGSWLSPHYWPGVVVYTRSMISDVLSIWLHVTLDNKHLSKLWHALNPLRWVWTITTDIALFFAVSVNITLHGLIVSTVILSFFSRCELLRKLN